MSRKMPLLQKSYQQYENLCVLEKNLLRVLLLSNQTFRKKQKVHLPKTVLMKDS